VQARIVAREPDDVTSTTWAASTPRGTAQLAAAGDVRVTVGRGVARFVALGRDVAVRVRAGALVVGVCFGGRVGVVVAIGVAAEVALLVVAGGVVTAVGADAPSAAESCDAPPQALSSAAAPTAQASSDFAGLTRRRSAGSPGVARARPS
jgi:hypothetical protein